MHTNTQTNKLWRTTGQSYLTDRMEDCSIDQSAVVWVQKPNFGSSCCGQSLVCRVWLSSSSPEFFYFSIFNHCAWFWNWLIGQLNFFIFPVIVSVVLHHSPLVHFLIHFHPFSPLPPSFHIYSVVPVDTIFHWRIFIFIPVGPTWPVILHWSPVTGCRNPLRRAWNLPSRYQEREHNSGWNEWGCGEADGFRTVLSCTGWPVLRIPWYACYIYLHYN